MDGPPFERIAGFPVTGRLTTQIGAAAGAGHQTRYGNLVSAGGAVEPVFTIFALDFGKTLLFLALRTLAVHFTILNIVFKQ